MKKGICVFTAILTLALLLGIAQTAHARKPADPSPGMLCETTPSPLPVLSFSDETGKPVQLADYAGKQVILHFWASWCPPCVEELPALAAYQKEAAAVGITVLAVSEDQKDPAEIRQFLQQHRALNLGVLRDSGSQGMTALELEGLPATFVIRPDGTTAVRHFGFFPWHDRDYTRALLECLR